LHDGLSLAERRICVARSVVSRGMARSSVDSIALA
jgi:hypothetical protein